MITNASIEVFSHLLQLKLSARNVCTFKAIYYKFGNVRKGFIFAKLR